MKQVSPATRDEVSMKGAVKRYWTLHGASFTNPVVLTLSVGYFLSMSISTQHWFHLYGRSLGLYARPLIQANFVSPCLCDFALFRLRVSNTSPTAARISRWGSFVKSEHLALLPLPPAPSCTGPSFCNIYKYIYTYPWNSR